MATTSCPSCGYDLPEEAADQFASEAQSRIEDLQTQVRLLNVKAAAAIDKFADYEDEIQSLRIQCAQLQKEKETDITVAPTDSRGQSTPAVHSPSQDPTNGNHDMHTEDNQNRNSLSRISNLWTRRRSKRGSLPENPIPAVPSMSAELGLQATGNQSTPNLTTPMQDHLLHPSPPPFIKSSSPKAPSLTLVGLQTSLETEREMRLKAEYSLMQTQSELEELTVQLFGQANEMVATERKARAKLEERVKLLETRDKEKRRRLERLEKAIERIDRVRKMVVEHENMLEREKENMDDMAAFKRSKSGREASPWPSTRARLKRKEFILRERKANLGGIEDEDTFEFDVRLKVWRRSQANMWVSPTLN